ncbi:phytoene desaturase family protein [Humisphaera borealis]|uniref:Phytoene dehydrogenase n=1 Tax=Humisphaera borealis TaxID=2807512 RepID=A0A7M2X1M9_9BACT|nr:phytoene desaturase family protein [Humisphaera borealis]QOV91509.1 phytoene desaturase [Humisphaera borealis]
MNPKAIVIGAGFGGLAAAARLRARGYDVTVFDKQNQPGGRAAVFERDGFIFDAGPTVVTAHFLFDELFALFGKKREDYIEFREVYPWYRIGFADGTYFNYGGTLEQTLDEIRKIEPDDCDGYLRLLEHTQRIFDVGFTQLGDKPFGTVGSMVKVAPQMIKLGAWRTVWQMACKYMKNDKLRRVFSFQPLLVGGNPFNTTSIYSLIQYLEREWKVHFAMGGTGAIVRGIVKLLEEEGVKFRLGEEVEQILVEHASTTTLHQSFPDNSSKWTDTKHPMRVTGVLLASGETHSADTLVCNADAPAVYKHLIASEFRPKWTDKKIEKLKYSMGLFVLYFGTKTQYPDVAHHTILLGDRYKEHLAEMFDLKKLALDDFSTYLHRPTATDPSMAPPGCDCFYVLCPVPNLQGDVDWKTMGPKYRDLIIDDLEKRHLPNLRANLAVDFYVTPEHFRDNLNTLHGTGFSIQPTFSQSAYFRFHNKSDDIANLFFVGAGTHPGAGMPGVLCSAKVLEYVLPQA